MCRIFKSFFLLLFPLLLGMHHPFYVSVTEVEYNSKNREIGIACKVFPDDMEETLRLFSQKQYDLSGKAKEQNNEALQAYFNKHLRLEINGKPKAMEYLGYENDKEAVWIYFVASKVSAVQNITVMTDMLYEYKPEQTNIIHVNWDGKKTSHRLSAPHKKVFIER